MQTRRAVQRSQEQIISVMENLQEAIEDDLKSWRQVDGKPTKEPAFEDIPTLRQASQKAYYRNAHGKGLIGTMVKFIIGAGVIIDFSEKDKEKLKSIVFWFGKFKRNIRWFSFLKEIARRLFRDGEVFLHKIPVKNKPLTFKFIDPAYILDEGIKRDKNDAETTISYMITPGNGVNPYELEADEVIHIAWDADRNMKRGRPFLEVQFPLLTKLDKWMDARIVLSIIRTNVALVREVQGSPMDLARIRSTQQTQRSTGTETNKAKMLRPGSILSSTPGVKWSMLSPNLDARDASEDGKMLKLGMAAGAGLPDVFVTGDFSNSNYASTVVSQNPAIRLFEETQNFLSEYIYSIVLAAIEDGIEQGRINAKVTEGEDGEKTYDIDTDFEVRFPPMLKRDLAQETNAYKVLNEMGVMSKRTVALLSGLNPDQEFEQLEEEKKNGQGPVVQQKTNGLANGTANGALSTDPTISHRKALAPKTPAERKPRQNVAAK